MKQRDPYLIAGAGKIIAINKKHSLNFNQYVWSMGHTCRWRGLGLGPHEYGVLHHIIAAGLLNTTLHARDDFVYAFWKGIFHELGETIYGDIPTPFKPEEIRQREVVVCVKFSENLVGRWKGYYGVRMAQMDYKLADQILAEVEGPFVLGISEMEVKEHGLEAEGGTAKNRVDARLLVRSLLHRPVGELRSLLLKLFRVSTASHIDKPCQRAYIDEFATQILK